MTESSTKTAIVTLSDGRKFACADFVDAEALFASHEFDPIGASVDVYPENERPGPVATFRYDMELTGWVQT